MPKYFREVNKHFSGDKTLAVRYMGVARSLLGGLVEMSADVFQNVRKVLLPDGTKIEVSFAGNIAQISIDVQHTTTQTTEGGCRAFLSGLLSVEQVSYVTAEDGSEYKALEWLYTSAYQKSLTPDIADKVAVKNFARDALVKTSAHELAMSATYAMVYPSAYSGQMRKAIQLFLGMGTELVTWYMDGYAGYVYPFGYDGTIGLVETYESTAEKPAFWLVKMPTAVNGIVAMPFPVCTKVTDAQREAGVTWVPISTTNFPVGVELEAAIAAGKVLELVSAAEFYDYTGGYDALYPDCGWAFSYSGHACQNVMKRVEEVAALDYRVYTKRFKVNFTVSEGLISASLSSFSEDLFFAGKEDAPRFPLYAPPIVSLIPDYDSYAAPHPSLPNPNIDCAVHVYYHGDDEQVWSYRSTYHAPGYQQGNYYAAAAYEVGYGGLVPGHYEAKDWDGAFYDRAYTINGSVVTQPTDTGAGWEYNMEYVIGGGFSPNYHATGGYSLRGVVGNIYRLNRYQRRMAATTGTYNVLLVPFHQREGVFIGEQILRKMDAWNEEPKKFMGCAHTGRAWNTAFAPDAGCGSGFTMYIVDSFVFPESYAMPPVYGEVVYCYTHATSSGGSGQSSITGCIPDIYTAGPSADAPDAATISHPASYSLSGGLEFYSAGYTVSIDFGTTTVESVGEQVYLDLYSVFHVEDLPAQRLFGFTDAFKPEKYLISARSAGVAGEDMTTNTGYPIAGMDTWGKTFIGIAN